MLKSKVLILILSSFCVFIFLLGSLLLIDHDIKPGYKSHTPCELPKNLHIKTSKNNYTIILFLHPHCPCSNATLYELRDILYKSKFVGIVNIVFLTSLTNDKNWIYGKNYKIVKKINNVHLITDNTLELFQIFNIKTSGHLLIYDINDKLLFNGGITESRGHIGDNYGKEAVINLLLKKNTMITNTPTYGCEIAH